jgi:predicted O-methyltransferase YrrM
MPEWTDIDGWLTEIEGDALQKLAQNGRVLELGAWKGRSTVCLAAVADSVVSVDTHNGDRHTGPADTYAEFLVNLVTHGVLGKVTSLRMDHDELTPECVGNSYSLVFVDGTHTAEAVKRDTRLALHAVSGLGGVVAWHDWSYPSVLEGVRWAGIDPATIDGQVGDLAWKHLGVNK